jgi:hypothetical protein
LQCGGLTLLCHRQQSAQAKKQRWQTGESVCPECFATIALLVTGALSAGGATAATVRFLRYKNALIRISRASDLKEKGK